MNKRLAAILLAITGVLALALTLLSGFQLLALPVQLVLGSRWLAMVALLLYSYYRKSLTVWILASMAIGVELGYDFPEVAKPLKVLSDIFLRLIKTIIAPLLFSTLVVGIAGHSSLKQVGRMGLKAIIYFEVVTTFALIIGLAAINFTGAGKGAVFQAQEAQVEKAHSLIGQKQSHDVILEIFPENIA